MTDDNYYHVVFVSFSLFFLSNFEMGKNVVKTKVGF